MKKNILVLFALLSMLTLSNAQTLPADSVPAAVKNTLKTKFPGVKKTEWKLKTDKNYEAEFDWKGAETAVKFDKAGKWLETEWAIKDSEVPDAVKKQISDKFKGYKQVETQKLESYNSKDFLYEIHLDNGTEILKIQFSEKGEVVTKSSKPSKKK